MPKREDLEDYQRRAVMAKKGMAQKPTFTLPEGVTCFRILNTPEDEARNSPKVWVEYYMHYNVGPKKFRQRCGIDPSDNSGDCWGCRKIEKLKAKGELELAKEMERKRVFEVQAAIFDDDIGGLRGPVRWPASGTSTKSLGYMLLTVCSGKKQYLDHKTGYNYTIERQGMKMTDTVYQAPVRDDEPSQVPVEIVRKLKPFVDVIPQYDEEAFKKTFYGQEEEEEDGMAIRARRRRDEEEEEPKPKRKIREEEPLEEDEEEERPKPKRKVVEPEEDEDYEPRKPKRRVVDEDEEDIDYGDEDDDEPKPKKKRPVEEDEEEEEEPKPKPKRKVVEPEEDEEEYEPRKPKRRVEVEEEDVEEDVAEEEEEPKPKPKRRVVEVEEEEEPRPKKKRPVEEDDLELSEDEEEAPKPKVKVTPKRRIVEPEEDEEEEERPKPRRR